LFGVVACFVGLNGGQYARVALQNYKIERQLANPVEDGIRSLSALEVQLLQELHLGREDVVR